MLRSSETTTDSAGRRSELSATASQRSARTARSTQQTVRRPGHRAARATASLVIASIVASLVASVLIGVSPAMAAPAGVGSCTTASVRVGNALHYAISWSGVTGVDSPGTNGAGYVLRRKPNGTNTFHWRLKSAPGTNSWFDNKPGDAGMTPSSYHIQTKDQTRSFGPVVACRTLSAPNNVALVQVQDAADAKASDVTIAWNPVAGATHYRLFRTDSTGNELLVGTFASTSATDRSVSDDHFQWSVSAAIQATDQDGVQRTAEGPRSSLRVSAPAKTTAVRVSVLDNSEVALSWDSVAEANGYNLHRIDLATNTETYLGWVGAGTTTWVDSAAASAGGSNYKWTVEPTARGNLKGGRAASRAVTVVVDQPSRTELFTEKRGDRWEIVSPAGETIRWEAVNLRTDKLAANPVQQADIDALASRFNAIRLVIHWDQLEPTNNQPDTTLLASICRILDWSATAKHKGKPLQVILDYAHFGGPSSGANTGWIPSFAWSSVGISTADRAKSTSFPIWSSAAYLDYVDYVMSEANCTGVNPGPLGQHPAIVAIEPMNEPHPEISGTAWTNYSQAQHVVVYDTIINRIRSHRADVPVVLGAFFGGHLYDNDASPDNQNWLRALTTSVNNQSVPHPNGGRPLIVNLPTQHKNLIWTAHNYFTGVDDSGCTNPTAACLLERDSGGPDYDGNGLPDPDGIGYRGARGAGLWTESYNSKGCYGYTHSGRWTIEPGGSGDPCPMATPQVRRPFARLGMRANAWNHDRISQEADMPFFMGEWGMGQERTDGRFNQGWRGAAEQMCDRLIAYRTVRPETQTSGGVAISWAAWAFDERVDGGFGLYNPSAPDGQRWQSHAGPFSSSYCRDSGTPN